MSPIYLYGCDRCNGKREILQGISDDAPICCNEPMTRLPTCPAKIEVKDKRGIRKYPEGYKEDYAKDYQGRLQGRKETKPTRKLAPARLKSTLR